MEKTAPTKIENATTQSSKNVEPIPSSSNSKIQNKKSTKKKQRRDKSDLGEHFIAPDGGFWAWLVCIAAGMSNLSVYPCNQQFGFIYRERVYELGFSTSEVTTTINANFAVSACTGLLNGPMFRRFSYRQVAIAGSILVFLGISFSAFCETFIAYIIFFSFLYGLGTGISASASALAMNTYFKNKRRRAMAFSWTITGLGPIFLPHLATFLLSAYRVEETVLIFAAFSLHSLVSAMTYEPAQYHSPKVTENNIVSTQATENPIENPAYICKYCELQRQKNPSQYFNPNVEQQITEYDIIEAVAPMLSHVNDAWLGSSLSLASHGSSTHFHTSRSSRDLEKGLAISLRMMTDLNLAAKPNNFQTELHAVSKRASSRVKFIVGDSTNTLQCTCAEERALMEAPAAILEQTSENIETKPKNNSFFQKVVLFFDLDLLRDFTYVNLVAGLTIIHFGELNFSILTPFILHDYGFESHQMTTATSVLASMDLLMRFLAPFLTEKIPWDNRVFFLIGVMGIAIGRTVVASTRSYEVVLVTFFFIGIFKGIRTVFWSLIIPGYVPLKRLPAASGLQLLITGLFTLAVGPLVGMVRDRFDYSVTIHCLNFMSFFAAFCWITEVYVRRWLEKRAMNL